MSGNGNSPIKVTNKICNFEFRACCETLKLNKEQISRFFDVEFFIVESWNNDTISVPVSVIRLLRVLIDAGASQDLLELAVLKLELRRKH